MDFEFERYCFVCRADSRKAEPPLEGWPLRPHKAIWEPDDQEGELHPKCPECVREYNEHLAARRYCSICEADSQEMEEPLERWPMFPPPDLLHQGDFSLWIPTCQKCEGENERYRNWQRSAGIIPVLLVILYWLWEYQDKQIIPGLGDIFGSILCLIPLIIACIFAVHVLADPRPNEDERFRNWKRRCFYMPFLLVILYWLLFWVYSGVPPDLGKFVFNSIPYLFFLFFACLVAVVLLVPRR